MKIKVIIWSYIKNGYYPIDKTVLDYLKEQGYNYEVWETKIWDKINRGGIQSWKVMLPKIEKYLESHDYILVAEDDALIHLKPKEIQEIINIYPKDIIWIGYQKMHIQGFVGSQLYYLPKEKFNYYKQELLSYTGAHGDMFLNKIEDVIVIPQQYKDKNVGELTRISSVTGKLREGDSNFKETKIYPLIVT